MEITNITLFHPEPLLNKLISGLDTSQLKVKIEYTSRSQLSGNCQYMQGPALIRLGINAQNQYPFPCQLHTGEYYMVDRSRKFIFQDVDFSHPEELIAGVFLHELSHYRDFQCDISPQYPEIRAFRYALAALEKFGIGVRRPVNVPRFPSFLPKDIEESLEEFEKLLGGTPSYPTVYRLLERADVPSVRPLPKTEAETLARLKELDEFDGGLPRRSRLKARVRQDWLELNFHLDHLDMTRRTRETRRELESRKWAYVNFQAGNDRPKVGDKVRIVTLGMDRAKVEWEEVGFPHL